MASKLRLVERETDAPGDLLKVCPPLPPPPFVLSGHAASLTPY